MGSNMKLGTLPSEGDQKELLAALQESRSSRCGSQARIIEQLRSIANTEQDNEVQFLFWVMN